MHKKEDEHKDTEASGHILDHGEVEKVDEHKENNNEVNKEDDPDHKDQEAGNPKDQEAGDPKV